MYSTIDQIRMVFNDTEYKMFDKMCVVSSASQGWYKKKIENTKGAYKEFKNCICTQARYKKWPKSTNNEASRGSIRRIILWILRPFLMTYVWRRCNTFFSGRNCIGSCLWHILCIKNLLYPVKNKIPYSRIGLLLYANLLYNRWYNLQPDFA